MKVNIKWKEGQCTRIYEGPVSAEEIVHDVRDRLPYDIITCLVDNKPKRLDTVIENDCELTLLDIRNKTADLSYQVSLAMLYIKAVHDVLGTHVQVKIENPLSKGLFTTIRTDKLRTEDVKNIEKRMRKLVEANLPLHRYVSNRDEVRAGLQKRHFDIMEEMLDNLPDLERLELYFLDHEHQMFYTDLVVSTGYLHNFSLKKLKEGVLLRFASPHNPAVIPEYKADPLLYRAFKEEREWGKLMEIHYSVDLNRRIRQNTYTDTILMSEALHEKKIAEIAGKIARSGKRIILIAGPSSSGKTTFSKRLMIQMRIQGLTPLYLGTDDYFVEREQTPIGPDGKPNFEDLDAVDVELFEKQMNELLSGKTVDLPVFDFMEGKKVYGRRVTSLREGAPIVIEGIHALNPQMTAGIADDEKFRIYISPLTELNLDPLNRIATTDARLLRRIVRDHQYRGRSAEKTIDGWESVRAGEEKNIFPFSGEADVFFNSECIYELPVLKKYAKKLLEEIPESSSSYADAHRLLEFLRFFVEVEDDSMIPNNSIIREFIGGSILADED